MRRLTSLLTATLLWIGFIAGLVAAIATSVVATLSSRYVVIDGAPLVIDGSRRQWLSYAGIAVSLVAGTLLARREPLKSFLASRPVLWFLFLFNGAAAVIAYFALSGVKGIATAAGLGVVSLGAGGGLLRSTKSPAGKPARD